MLQRLTKKYPDYYYGNALHGFAYLETGNLKEAERNYTKAYDLFPIEDNEKALTAILKAIEKKQRASKYDDIKPKESQ